MAVDIFCSSLGNAHPQTSAGSRTSTLEYTVHAGNEFNQIQTPSDEVRIPVLSVHVDESDEETTIATAVKP